MNKPFGVSSTRRSLEMPLECWAEIESVCLRNGAVASRGRRGGQYSWRTLLRMIADGELVVVNPALLEGQGVVK